MPQTEKNEQRERAHDGPERQDLTTESRSVATGVSEKGDQEDGPQETRKPERDNSPAGAQPDTSEAVVDNPKRSGKLQLVLVILAISISNFSTAYDSGLNSSTHAAIASNFNHANLSSWLVNSFVLTSMVFQPLYGGFSDLVGRRIPYLFASFLFAAAILLSSFAPIWGVLLFARALCGIGSAGVVTMGSVLLTDVVGVKKRGYYQSLNYMIYGTGNAMGAALGGIIVEQLGWSWAYKTQIPITVLAAVLLACFVPKSRGKREGQTFRQTILAKFDWKGSLFLVAALGSLFVCLTLGGNVYNWKHPAVITTAVTAILSVAGFAYIETKVANPVLPPYLFLAFPTGNLMCAGFLASLANSTLLYNTPLFFQLVKLDSVRDAGLRLVVPSITFTVSSALTGSLVARLGSPRLTMAVSQVMLFAGGLGLVLMASIFQRFGVPDAVYYIMLALPTVGVAMLAPSTVLALLNITPTQDQAVANSGLIMFRSLGIFVSTALSTAILQNLFLSVLGRDELDSRDIQTANAVREDPVLLKSIPDPLKLLIINAYQKAFTATFGICLAAACIIVAMLWRVRVDKFKPE